MKYLSFVLLIISFVSAPTYGTTKSARGLADFTAISGSDPDFVGFLASAHFRRVPTTHSRHHYATHLEAAFELYKASLAGGEAPATTKEIEDMNLNAFSAVKDVLNQLVSDLGYDVLLLNAIAATRNTIADTLDRILLQFVPTASEHSAEARTILENFKKDVIRAPDAPDPIDDEDFIFQKILDRISRLTDPFLYGYAYTEMESLSISRDVYNILKDGIIAPRTFNLEDLRHSIAWASHYKELLDRSILLLSNEISRLRTELSTPSNVIVYSRVMTNGLKLPEAGVPIVGPALPIINTLADRFLLQKGKVTHMSNTIRAFCLSGPTIKSEDLLKAINDII